MAKKPKSKPQNYYLNERHQLTPVAKSGGGGAPKFGDIDWGKKAEQIGTSITRLTKDIEKSNDPLKEDRFFAIAIPEIAVPKLSTDKKKAPAGTYSELTDYSSAHSKVLERLGLDLIDVSNQGTAIVHGKPEIFEQLQSRSSTLQNVGIREQARWSTIESFATIPMKFRLNPEWLATLASKELTDVVFELQPLINKVEANDIFQTVSDLLSSESNELLTGAGVDFSGRYWVRGKALPSSIKKIAKNYFSIQSIHHPLFSYFSAGKTKPTKQTAKSNEKIRGRKVIDKKMLPCVAVVDTGSPTDHLSLKDYRRGQFIAQGAFKRDTAEHGTGVASRVVYGDCKNMDELSEKAGECSFYDVVVADALSDRVDDKLVVPALTSVRGAAPDVRVFNLSFGSREPLSDMDDIVYRERLIELQELDNFAFANDAIIVVAAGNSNKGVIPETEYPNHYTDPRWRLGAWACGYNTLVCGSHVTKLSPDGLADLGHPSPFSRVGYGLNSAPVPSFSNGGGNCDATYNYYNGGGVFTYGSIGLIEEVVGTSHSAPILAREAAMAIYELRKYCPSGSEPSAVLVRACLATFAQKTTSDSNVKELCDRTLGYGETNHKRIVTPNRDSAIVMWQGVLESTRDLLRVRIPIPKDWLTDAKNAELRLCVCYDSPVNHAALKNWACRKIDITVKTEADNKAVRGGTNRAHQTYPLFFRNFNLTKICSKTQPAYDSWIIELKYQEISPYVAGNTFDPRQKVAVVAELIDLADDPVSPHSSLQALPFASELNLLAANRSRSIAPVIIQNR